jgi:putative DNA primase/helicase
VKDGALFSDLLHDNSGKYYGTAFRAFIERLIVRGLLEHRDEFKDYYRDLWHREFGDKEIDAMIGRAFKYFALAAFAGELAIELGVAPWPKGTAEDGAMKCFRDWLTNWGGDEGKLLDQARDFLERNQSRFIRVKGKVRIEDRAAQNQAGFREVLGGEVVFCIYTGAFKNDVCAGFDFKWAREVLLRRGWLTRMESKAERLGLEGPQQVYRISIPVSLPKEAEEVVVE